MSGLRHAIVICLCLGVLIAVLLPAVQQAREAARTTESRNNLKQISLSLHNYHDAHKMFPFGSVASEDGRMYYGWQTPIMPYIDASPLYNWIDFDYPWNDPYNAPVFRTKYPVYLNPSIVPDRDQQGFALTHYSVSSHLFWKNGSLPLDEIVDATILGGEIGDGFPAWGRPGNWRDPALGLKSGADSFGVSWRDDINLLLIDGGVRAVNQGIDPQVLKALSSPDGSDFVPEEFRNAPAR